MSAAVAQCHISRMTITTSQVLSIFVIEWEMGSWEFSSQEFKFFVNVLWDGGRA